ncbi:hypothetical protein MFLAVUS_002739 [Mucor flavus]|uniref:t-SNARE coiled-coil homology domain-containing protein n=1 Tax=Mucor flavus TaxID=439312 RepID=A0ABP9YR55_9FUNG
MLRKENMPQKFVLSDEQVELYIHAFFKVSPRRDNCTAPAYEWLQFLDLYNEREGHYVLNNQEMDVIRPYCEANSEVELTPDDFIRLLHLVRHNKLEPEPTHTTNGTATAAHSKPLFDSRPRSSRLLSRKKDYYSASGRASLNHPSITDDSSVKSVYSNDDAFIPPHSYTNYDSELVDTLKKSNMVATKQAKDYESKMLTMSIEHSERIALLQTRLEYMNIEAEQQKTLVMQQKHKERERLDKIGELQAIVDESEAQIITNSKKLQKKNEELDNIRTKLSSVHETLQISDTKVRHIESELYQAKERIRVLEHEKSDLQAHLEQEKVVSSDGRSELEEQQNENTKLLELIDRQKFDLDEARSGLRYHNASPALDKKLLHANQNNTGESTLAQEQVEAEYLKKIKLLESERDQCKQNMIKQQDEFDQKLSQAINEKEATIESLSSQFDKQHELIDSIQADILFFPKNKAIGIYTAVSWIFLTYHLIMLLTVLFFTSGIKPSFYFMKRLSEWYTSRV